MEEGFSLRDIERAIINSMRARGVIPEEIALLIDCLLAAGCPLTNILIGMNEFGEKMALENLLKDIKVEGTGNE